MNAPAKMKYCEACNKHIQKSSFTKHLKSKLHLHNVGGVASPEARPPEVLQQQQPRTVPTFKKLARAKINLSNRELDKKLLNT